MRFLKKIGGRGTVVLPSDLREAMDLHEGDIVEFDLIGVVRRSGESTPRAEKRTTQNGTEA